MRIDQYPLGSRVPQTTDYVIALVTGQLCDLPISSLAALISGSGTGFWLGGTTAQRPASPVLYMMYFDTTLGQPVWCKQASPAVWVNAAGVTV